MLDSGNNEFVYINCVDAIKKGITEFTVEELQKGFSREEIIKWETKNKNHISMI